LGENVTYSWTMQQGLYVPLSSYQGFGAFPLSDPTLPTLSRLVTGPAMTYENLGPVLDAATFRQNAQYILLQTLQRTATQDRHPGFGSAQFAPRQESLSSNPLNGFVQDEGRSVELGGRDLLHLGFETAPFQNGSESILWGVEWLTSFPEYNLVETNQAGSSVVVREVTCQRCTATNVITNPQRQCFCEECGVKLPKPSSEQVSIEKNNLGVAFVDIQGINEQAMVGTWAPQYRTLVKRVKQIAFEQAVTVKYLNGGKLMLVSGLGSEADDAKTNLLRLMQVLEEINAYISQSNPHIVLTTSIDVGAGYHDENDLFGVPLNKAQRQLQSTLRNDGFQRNSSHRIVVTQEVRDVLSVYYGTSTFLKDQAYKGFVDQAFTVYQVGLSKIKLYLPELSYAEKNNVNPVCRKDHSDLSDKYCQNCGSAFQDPTAPDLGVFQNRVVLAVDMSGFTKMFAALGPRGVAKQVGIFMREIEYELAKEGGHFEDIIHRAGDELAVSIEYIQFGKMLRATIRAFNRITRRYPDIKIKAAFARSDLMEYSDGMKIGDIRAAQSAQDTAGVHGIVIHSSLMSEIPEAILTELPEDSATTSGEQNILAVGIRSGLSFLTSEGFMPTQREIDAVRLAEIFHLNVVGREKLALVSYVGSADTGKAMGLAGFLNKINFTQYNVMHGAAFRFQKDPIRNALLHRVASYEDDKLTEEALDAFLAALGFFEESFEHSFEQPEKVVKDLLARYLGLSLDQECEETSRLRNTKQLFVETTRRIVAHVIGRLASEKPLVLIMFNMGLVSRDPEARQLISDVVSYNKDKPIFLMGLEDRDLTASEKQIAPDMYWKDLLKAEELPYNALLEAEPLDREAVIQAILYIYNEEVNPMLDADSRASMTIHLGAEGIHSDVVDYYYRQSHGNVQVMRALLHDHARKELLQENSAGQLAFAGKSPQALTTSAVRALHLAPLRRLSSQEKAVFESISLLVGKDVLFHERELPQHDEQALGAVGLVRVLASLKQKGYIADEANDHYRVVRVPVRDAIQDRVKESQQIKQRHGDIVTHLETLNTTFAREHALLGYHLFRTGQYEAAYKSYEEAAKVAQKNFNFTVQLTYLREKGELLRFFEGVDKLRKQAALLKEQISIYKEEVVNVNGDDPWLDSINAYQQITHDDHFNSLSIVEREEIILDGFVILPGEHKLKREPLAVAAFYERVAQERAAFLDGMSLALQVKFHIRAMGACQAINNKQQQMAADQHVAKAVALVLGDQDASIADHERLFASPLLQERPDILARVCLNIASRYSVHGHQQLLALPYIEKAIAMGANSPMALFAKLTLGINLNACGLLDDSIAHLEALHEEALHWPENLSSVLSFSQKHLAVALIKKGLFGLAHEKLDYVLNNKAYPYSLLLEDATAHKILVMAFEDPENVDVSVANLVLKQGNVQRYVEDSFTGYSRRPTELFLALFMAEAIQGNTEEAKRYLDLCLSQYHVAGHVEDFNTEMRWLRRNRDRMQAVLDSPSSDVGLRFEAPYFLASFVNRLSVEEKKAV
jgi:hypothetical protein